ncbi:MAG: NADH-quinone oxidoreductase subunit N [FCB group bacterium]|nr:NADH-quinone oxidoreductase subunit N [FCB group bacterium]
MSAFPQIDFNLLLPHILLAGSASLLLIIDLFIPAHRKSINQFFATLFLLITLVVTYSVLWGNPVSSTMLHADGFAVFFIFIFISAAVLVILTSDQYLRTTNSNIGEFYALIIFAAAGASVMASAADLITLFIGLEIMSLSLYILAGLRRERLASNEAAMKYFLIGAFFSGFLLYGIMLIFSVTGTTNIAEIVAAANSSSVTFVAGAVLVFLAFAFKASLFPFHFWSPDVYDGAPTPVSAFMATAAKAAAFAAILRVFFHLFPKLGIDVTTALWIVAALTMTVGNTLAIAQSNLKRMLAYSSVAHAGYLFVGFLAVNESTVQAIMFYLFAYTLMNVGAFTVAYLINKRGTGDYQLNNLAGIGVQHPLLAVAMAVFMFSLAGIPPTAGFFGKFYLFRAALDAGFVYLVIIAVLNSALSVFYYLRVLVIMFMQKEEHAAAPVKLGPPVSVALILCVIGILSFGIFPGALIDFLQLAGL